MQSMKHPLTDSGLKSFLDDYNRLQTEISKLTPNRIEIVKPNLTKPAQKRTNAEQSKSRVYNKYLNSINNS